MKHIIVASGTPGSPRPRRPRLRAALALALAAALLAACDDEGPKPSPEPPVPEGFAKVPATRGNPASKNCEKTGGTLVIGKRPDGGEYGVCIFLNGGQCEEWAMLLGFCPPGGVDVSVYPTPAARYCVMRGGKYIAGESEGAAQCLVVGGETCPVDAYFAGTCGAPE